MGEGKEARKSKHECLWVHMKGQSQLSEFYSILLCTVFFWSQSCSSFHLGIIQFVFSRHLGNFTIILHCVKGSLKCNMRFFIYVIYFSWLLWTVLFLLTQTLISETLFFHENRRRWENTVNHILINLSHNKQTSTLSQWWFSDSTNARFNASFMSHSLLCVSICPIIYE